MDQALIPRQLAISAGLKRYFTGVACKRGHVAERQTSNGFCTRCEAGKDRGEYLAEWRARNTDKTRAYTEKRVLEGQFRGRRAYHLKFAFGITLAEYASMYHAQDGKCAICKEAETTLYKGKVISLSVDHEHNTGNVRGLLCNRCNVGIARFRDSADVLRAAANYLDHSSGVEKVSPLKAVV